MHCPQCDSQDTAVTDTRPDPESRGRKRYRKCKMCGERFVTIEKVQHKITLPMVIKRNGKPEEFSENKLKKGIHLALAKSSVSDLEKENIFLSLMKQVLQCNQMEITSQWLGQIALSELQKLDTVAYVRFASVYRDVTDIGALKAELDQIQTIPDEDQLLLQLNKKK